MSSGVSCAVLSLHSFTICFIIVIIFLQPQNTNVYVYICILLQTVLFRPSGPHQCSADEGMEVKLEKSPRMLHACGNI